MTRAFAAYEAQPTNSRLVTAFSPLVSSRRVRVIALAVFIAGLAGYLPFAPTRLVDFRAFYCAGKAVAMHADPYREHPLRECERATEALGMSAEAADVTLPAPLPGFVLAIFAVLSYIPFGSCVVVWLAASIAALTATVELLLRTIAAPRAMIAVSIGLPAAAVAIPLGQPAPFVGCAIALCAYGLTTGRTKLAAFAALTTAFYPAITLVLCTTLLIAVPATRKTIIGGTICLGILSIVALGVDTNLEYIRAVLHDHAAANVAERSQFSTTHFAWLVGVPAARAIAVGNVWYAVVAVIGIYTACKLRIVYGTSALALVPPAFAVFGGVYVHYSQLALAIPAFLMILQAGPFARKGLTSAIFVFAVPWLALAVFPPFAVALVAAAILYAGSDHVRAASRLGIAAGVLLVAFFILALFAPPTAHGSFSFVPLHNPLVEVGWSRYIAWRDPGPNALFLTLQLPTVLASTFCLLVLIRSGIVRSPCPYIEQTPLIR